MVTDEKDKSSVGHHDEKSSSSSRFGSFLFHLLIVSALIALGVYAYFSYQQINALEQKTQQDKNSIKLLTEQAKKTFTELDEMRRQNSAEMKALQDFKDELESAQSRLINLSGNTNWVLAQANYLALMANERLNASHDVITALTQLNAADEQLKKLGNPALIGIRQALAKDIAKLRDFPVVDRQRIWEQLALLSQKFNQLHYNQITNQVLSEKTEVAKDDASWRQGLLHSWQEFKSLIRVTRLEENPIPEALSEEEQAQILRVLQLICEQAQWAVLQGDAKIYSYSLQSLQSWVQRYFTDDATKQHVLDEIKQLAQQQIEIASPDISGSLQALSQAMQVTHKGERE